MGAKRAAAGLADVLLTADEITRTKRERAARALVSLLPFGSAAFVLQDPPESIPSRPAVEVAEAMVRILSGFGASQLESAYSFLGRLLSWAAQRHPSAATLIGSTVTEFLDSSRPSAANTTAMIWLRDRCGVALPARGPACKPFRRMPSLKSNDKESLSVLDVRMLEHVASSHPQPFVSSAAMRRVGPC